MDDGLVEVQRLGAGGEHAVLGRSREGKALGLDVLAPALPGLQRHVVAASGERPPEGDHREGVAGVAEGAQRSGGPAVRTSAGLATGEARLGDEPQLREGAPPPW